MSSSMDLLMAEHRVIERVLACVERMAATSVPGRPFDAASARSAIEFLRTFADACHHGKEEGCLFPLLEQRGVPRDGGPIGVMLQDHVEGRGHIRGMNEAIDGAAAGKPEALRSFQSHALAYVDLLRQHIAKEDQVLFRIADQVMPPQDEKDLLTRFAEAEQRDLAPGAPDKFRKVADDLCTRFGVTEADVRASTPQFGCGPCGGH